MTSKELKWVDAAIKVLAEKPGVVWMTAPEMVREIQRKDIRTIKNSYSQAVRTLRAALNGNSKKPYSTFCRSDEDSNVSFALRQRLDSAPHAVKPAARPRKRKAQPLHEDQACVPISNGLPPLSPPLQSHHAPVSPHPTPSTNSPTHVTSATSATTQSSVCGATSASNLLANLLERTRSCVVEIDASVRPNRPSKLNLEPDITSHMCLPSPLTSILGPRKTLQVLSESTVPASLRPVRQVRKRQRTRDSEEDAPLSPIQNGHDAEGLMSPPPPISNMSGDMLQVETCHVVKSPHFDVACVRPLDAGSCSPTGLDDPCHAQGNRSHLGYFEPKPSQAKRARGDGDSSTECQTMSSDSESESDLSDVHIQYHPSSRLLVSRRLSQQRRRPVLMDYSQLSEEGLSETNDDSEDVDVEYVDPSCYSKGHAPEKKGRGSLLEHRKVEQRRNISSLFQPQSPLISENMKSLLNMESFMSLTEAQRTQLVKLLPAVDRAGPSMITPDCLNNSFFSSALREWVEQLASGGFTVEYRARLRAEEKRRASCKAAENAWKARFFEKEWGDSIDGNTKPPDSAPKPPDITPFYPHHKLSDSSAECLNTILEQYYGKDKRESPSSPSHTPIAPPATPPSPPPPPPPALPDQPSSSNSRPSATTVATPAPSQRKSQRTMHPTKKTARPVKANSAAKKAILVATEPIAKSGIPSPKKNHAKKITSKFSLPSLLSKSSRVSKATSKKTGVAKSLLNATKKPGDELKASRVIEQLRLNSHHRRVTKPEFLTLLPPRTPYQSLLMALSQASKGTKDAPPPPSSPPKDQSPPNSTRHTHSVFHDHFALLGAHHVPSEFSAPITSLSLQLPIDVYTSCVRARLTREEHSYAKAPELSPAKKREESRSQQLNLKLSLPRSLLQSNDAVSSCGCNKGALVFCSCCHSLYHSTCSSGTLCTKCLTLKSLNLS